MVILDEPYASKPLVEWLSDSHHPVLDNGFSRRLAQGGYAFNLVGEEEAIRRLESGERVYSNSENALAWISSHVRNETLCRSIALFKDKAAMRERLAKLDPDLFFRVLRHEELADVDPADLPLPVVLKPSVGFCSMGVYVIASAEDWTRALDDIAAAAASWNERYPGSVIDTRTYLVEGYLEGDEYALDAYFDEQGAPHLLNVYRHEFAGKEDTSDRLYCVDEKIITETAPRFVAWLSSVNEIVGARGIPVHVEVRVDGNHIAPIEFNPLRFAGLGGTDLAYYAWGMRTYAAFLEGKEPDLARLARGGSVWSMSLLTPSSTDDLSRPFDYEALTSHFGHVLEMRRFDVERVGSWGFLFLEASAADRAELDYLLRVDLSQFLGDPGACSAASSRVARTAEG